jgi:hypothetical protein
MDFTNVYADIAVLEVAIDYDVKIQKLPFCEINCFDCPMSEGLGDGDCGLSKDYPLSLLLRYDIEQHY